MRRKILLAVLLVVLVAATVFAADPECYIVQFDLHDCGICCFYSNGNIFCEYIVGLC